MHLRVDATQAYRTFVAKDGAPVGESRQHSPVCPQLACLAHVDGDVELALEVDLRYQAITRFDRWSLSAMAIFNTAVDMGWSVGLQ
jgi:hypothetical protein